MVKKFKVLTLLALVSCAHNKTGKQKIVEQKERVPKQTYTFDLQQKTIYPGRVRPLEFLFPFTDSSGTKLLCGGKEFPYYNRSGKAFALISESYFHDRKQFSCYITSGDQKYTIAEFKVLPYQFKKERLYVNKRRVVLSEKDSKRVAKEQGMLNKLYAASGSRPLFQTGFIAPLETYITSRYGTKRIFNNKKQTQHLGTDFRAAVGVPIPASNDGRVAFVGELFYTGNTVIVDHGLRIFSVYAHLSATQVKVGSLVKKGDIVGKAGASGRVTGPHLHWGVKVNGDWIDGFSLINNTRIPLTL